MCPKERARAHGGPISYNLGGRGDKGYNLTGGGGLAWDYEELGRHVDALAGGLLDMGVKKGDRVGVIMGNTRYAIPFIFYIKLTRS